MISVLIASLGRPSLAETLASVARARVPAGETVEVIVADDGGEGRVAAVVAALPASSNLPAIRVVPVGAGNVSLARNACLDAARGDWLIFVDDDETVDAGWLEGHLSAARDFDADAVFGPVHPRYPEGTPAWFVAADPLFQDWHWQEDGRRVPHGRTGNTLVRRAALGDLRFDPVFGRSGGEDHDFFLRFAAAGGRMVVTDRARADETVPAERATPGYVLERAVRTGQLYARMRLAGRGPLHRLGFGLGAAVKFLGGLVVATVLRPVDPGRALRLRKRAATNLGKLRSLAGRPLMSAWDGEDEHGGGPSGGEAGEGCGATGAAPVLLHVSSDYLDPIRPPPITDAVVRLVDRTGDHRRIVVSLQRVVDPRRIARHDFGTVDRRRLIVLRYFAPPFGIGMAACQAIVAFRILRFLAAEGLRPDIVHTHRFTFEGIAGWLVARRLGAAFVASTRGEVERKVFRAKPTYRPLFRRMARDAARIFHVSAWFAEGFARHTGIDPGKVRTLPNIVLNARREIPEVAPEPVLVAPMSLRALDKKGLPDLIAGFARAGSALDGIRLEIIGEGPPEVRARVRAMIAAHRLEGRVELRDFMAHEALLDRLTRALGLAMPSHEETFGMVYLEALFAGIPILHTVGVGIDGHLDGLDVAVRVAVGDVEAIAAGLVRLVRDNPRLRAAIRAEAGVLHDRFAPAAIVGRYRAEIDAVMRERRGGKAETGGSGPAAADPLQVE
jgi:glycosyltransferase involved in cell wall biosynthesis